MMKQPNHSLLALKPVLYLSLFFSLFSLYGMANASSLAIVEQRPVISPGFYDMYPGKIDVNGDASITLPSRALLLEQTDISIKGFTVPLQIKRVYRSDRKSSGVFGKGWMLSGIPSLLHRENLIILTTAYGISVFTKNEAGNYVGNSGLIIKLKKPGFILSGSDGTQYRFSESGQIHSKQDANNNRISYRYDDSRLVEITDTGSSRSISLAYNKAGQVASIKDNSGRIATYKYNNGQLTQLTLPDQQIISFRYQAGGLSRIVGEGRSDLNIDYDNSGDGVVSKVSSGKNRWLKFKAIESQGSLSVQLTDSRGNRFKQSFSEKKGGIEVEITGKNGWRAEYLFSTNFNLLEARLPDGYTLSKQYDESGRLIAVRDNRGRDTALDYKGESFGPATVSDKQAGTTNFQYDDRNNLSSIKKNRHKISYYYSKAGKLLAVYANKNKLTDYHYDKSGNQIEKIHQGYMPVRTSYDVLGRIEEEQNNYNSDKSFLYDSADRITRISSGKKDWLNFNFSTASALKGITDANGRSISYEYDNYARPVSTAMPDGSRFERQYQFKGSRQIVKTLFPGDRQTKLIIDQLNRPIEFVDSLGNSSKYDWTSGGKPKKIEFADKSSVQHSYDKTGRIVKSTYSDGSQETYRYDGNRIIQMTSGDFQRDYLYRDSVIEPVGFTDKPTGIKITLEYTENNKLKTITIPDIGKISYDYNRHGQLASITDPRGKKYEYTFNKGGYISQIAYPNQVKQTISIDKDTGSVDSTEIKHKSTVLLRRKYDYQGNQLIAGFEDDNSSSFQYSYGKNDELIEATYLSKKGREKTHYRYGPNGNLVEEKTNSRVTKYRYSGIGNLTNSGKQSYRYDKRGNLIEIVEAGKPVRLTYSINNKLTSVIKPNGEQKLYRYDPLGHLVYIKHKGKETHIIWNGDHRLLEVDGSGKVNRVYIYGEGVDRLLAILEDGKARYFHQDKIGSVILVSDEQGKVLSRPEYDPYGRPRGTQQAYDNHWFSGRPYDPVLGAYYLRARYYFPDIKRFGSRDPVSGDMLLPTTMNPYLYALNNPVNASDPSGRIFMALAATAGIAVITGGVIIYKVAEAIGDGAGFSSVRSSGGEFRAADVKGSTERLGRAVRDIQSHVNNMGGTSTLFTTGLDPSNSALGFGLTAGARLGYLPLVSNTPADLVLNPGMIDAMSDPGKSGSQQFAQGAAHLLIEGANQLGTGLFVSVMNTGVLRSLPGLLGDTLKGAAGMLTRAGSRVVTSLGEAAQAGYQAATVPGARQAAQTAAATAVGTALSGAGSSANAQSTDQAAAISQAAINKFQGEVSALKGRCGALDNMRAERRSKSDDALRLGNELRATMSGADLGITEQIKRCSKRRAMATNWSSNIIALAQRAAQGNQGAQSILLRCNSRSDLDTAAQLQKMSGAVAREAASKYRKISVLLNSGLPESQAISTAELSVIAALKPKLNAMEQKGVTLRNYLENAKSMGSQINELRSSCNNTLGYLTQEVQKRSNITGDAGFQGLLAQLQGIEATTNVREFDLPQLDFVNQLLQNAREILAALPAREAELNTCIAFDTVTPLLQAQAAMAQIKDIESWDSKLAGLRGQCTAKLDKENDVADTDTETDCKFRGRDGKCVDNVVTDTPRVGGDNVDIAGLNPSGSGDMIPGGGSSTGQSGAGTAIGGGYSDDPRERQRQDDQRAENQADVNRGQGGVGPDGRSQSGGGHPGSDIATSFGTPTLPDDPVINEPANTTGQTSPETGGITTTGKPTETKPPKPPGKSPSVDCGAMKRKLRKYYDAVKKKYQKYIAKYEKLRKSSEAKKCGIKYPQVKKPTKSNPPKPPSIDQRTVSCSTATKSGRDAPATITVQVGNRPGKAIFSYNMINVPDRMIVVYGGRTLVDTGCVSGSKTISLNLDGSSSQAKVIVKPACKRKGTRWSFTLSCPRPSVQSGPIIK